VFDNFQGKRIPFVKASACGNDFLIIDGRYAPDDPAELTRRLCDRHNGVGADGVEWLYRDEQRDGLIHLINADGSRAEISGNGTRCVAAFLAAKTGKTRLVIATDAGDKVCELRRRENARFYFHMQMGTPRVGDEFALKLRRGTVRGTAVSMGNPHYVVFVNEFPHDWQAVSEEIQGQEQAFHDGVNVEFVTVTGPSEITIRIYERGAGETQSSGTGTSATASAALAAGKVQGPKVAVVSPGGAQTVEWDGGSASLALEGPADLLCKGEFFA
jgi:diaminopimelate epimerase